MEENERIAEEENPAVSAIEGEAEEAAVRSVGNPDGDEIRELREKLARMEEAGRAAREELRIAQENLRRAEEERCWADENRRLAEEERDAVSRRSEERLRAAALRRYLAEKGLSGRAMEIAERGLGAEAFALGEDDAVDAESRTVLDALLEGVFKAGDGVSGYAVAKPPLGSGVGSMTREEILGIRDGAARRRAIAENPAVFGL